MSYNFQHLRRWWSSGLSICHQKGQRIESQTHRLRQHSLSPGLLPHLTWCDLELFYVAPSFRVTIAGPTPVPGLSGYAAGPVHYNHAWSEQRKLELKLSRLHMGHQILNDHWWPDVVKSWKSACTIRSYKPTLSWDEKWSSRYRDDVPT